VPSTQRFGKSGQCTAQNILLYEQTHLLFFVAWHLFLWRGWFGWMATSTNHIGFKHDQKQANNYGRSLFALLHDATWTHLWVTHQLIGVGVRRQHKRQRPLFGHSCKSFNVCYLFIGGIPVTLASLGCFQGNCATLYFGSTSLSTRSIFFEIQLVILR